MKRMPDDLRDLDRKLRSVRFGPRASFGPELLGRLRRGDQPRGGSRRDLSRHLATAAVALLAAGAALALANLGFLSGVDAVTVDRCCYDLDGGGDVDDGVLILPSATTGCTVSVSMRTWTAREATPRETWCGSIAAPSPPSMGWRARGSSPSSGAASISMAVVRTTMVSS